jgi:uncharacterized protein YfkK (UPF0435 family)
MENEKKKKNDFENLEQIHSIISKIENLDLQELRNDIFEEKLLYINFIKFVGYLWISMFF